MSNSHVSYFLFLCAKRTTADTNFIVCDDLTRPDLEPTVHSKLSIKVYLLTFYN